MSIVEKTKQWLVSIPLSTRFFFLLCVAVFILSSSEQVYIGTLCSSPTYILDLQYKKFYTLFTSTFTHGGALHILFNMSSFIQLKSLEISKFGTLLHFYLILLFSVLIHLMAFVISFILSYPPISHIQSLYSCSVGLSGVIFALLEIQCYGSIHSTSLFAQIKIPLKLYPWAALLIAQFLLPNVSFVGHLSGILIGLMYVIGLLDPLVPSTATLLKIEQSNMLRSVTSMGGYITNLNYGSNSSMYNSSSSSSNSSSSVSNLYNRFISSVRSDSTQSNPFSGQGRMLGQSPPITAKTLPYSPSIDMSIEKPTTNHNTTINTTQPTVTSPTIAILPTTISSTTTTHGHNHNQNQNIDIDK